MSLSLNTNMKLISALRYNICPATNKFKSKNSERSYYI